MSKQSITSIPTYSAATTALAINQHFEEFLAKTTKVITVADGSIISIRNQSGLSRHSLPIMISAEDQRNTTDKNLFFLDTFGLKDSEADFMYTATILSAIWEDPTINESFNGVQRLASGLYNQWLAGAYTRQFGLSVEEGNNVKVVVGLYYQFQGMEIDLSDADTIHRVIRQVADASGVPDRDVKGIIDKYDILTDGEVAEFSWFLTSLKKVSEILNYRMNGVTALSIVSNSWYRGMTAQPQLALNYKPFFIAMLYTAFNDRSASRTGIDIMIKNALEGRRRQQAETFVGAIESIMRAQVNG